MSAVRREHRDYSQRDVLDKLGVREGQAVRIVGSGDEALLARLWARVARGPATADEQADLILHWPATAEEIGPVLTQLRPRLKPAGGLWVVMPKRGHPGYRDLAALIPLGKAAGLVDNKSISLSERESAIRFVIPRAARTRNAKLSRVVALSLDLFFTVRSSPSSPSISCGIGLFVKPRWHSCLL